MFSFFVSFNFIDLSLATMLAQDKPSPNGRFFEVVGRPSLAIIFGNRCSIPKSSKVQSSKNDYSFHFHLNCF